MSVLLKFLERPKINITCQTILPFFLSGLVNISTMSALEKIKDVRPGISSCLCLQVLLPHYHKMTLSLKNHKNVAREKEWKYAEGKLSFYCCWFFFSFFFFKKKVWIESCKQSWALKLVLNSNVSFNPTVVNGKQIPHELLLFHIKLLKFIFQWTGRSSAKIILIFCYSCTGSTPLF